MVIHGDAVQRVPLLYLVGSSSGGAGAGGAALPFGLAGGGGASAIALAFRGAGGGSAAAGGSLLLGSGLRLGFGLLRCWGFLCRRVGLVLGRLRCGLVLLVIVRRLPRLSGVGIVA